MDEKRDLNEYASGEMPSAYSDAYYREAPQTRRDCYGFNPVQCYARAGDAGSGTAGRKKSRGLASVTLLCVAAILAAGLLGAGGLILSYRVRAVSDEMATREIYEDYSVTAESGEEDTLGLRRAGEEFRTELSAEEIYLHACQCTVGVTIPGYAQNIFGQTSSSTVTGTGIVLSQDGYILTNFHVIEEAYARGAPLHVITYGGDDFVAEVVGVEMDSDLAVLKIDAEGMTPAEIGDSTEMRVGQTIYAVGNPLGELTYTMTSGIVSALDRQVTTDVNVTVNMFQIDAAVNSGNSGGPVFNAYGEVIGVVTAKYSLDGMEGLGFAIPVNDACRIACDLVDKGYVSGKAYLGLTLATVSPSVARYYDMVPGVFVYAVEPGSCAEKAGLREGDVITAIDGEEVMDSEALARAVKRYRAGESAVLTVCRDEGFIDMTVVFDEELPAEAMTEEEAALRSSREIIVRQD